MLGSSNAVHEKFNAIRLAEVVKVYEWRYDIISVEKTKVSYSNLSAM